MIHDRDKNRNLIITGTANCAKTFMLKSLKLIFRDSIFENPATDKYAWLGYEKAKVFLFSDSKWSIYIPWHDMLLLLERQSSFYEIQSLAICINIKAFHRINRKQLNILKMYLEYLEFYIVAY